MKDIQKKINEIYSKVFSYTPQSERIEDIQKQFFKLMRNTGVQDLKESTSDLLSSLIQLCNESDWDIEDLINLNLEKIEKRKNQYISLGRKKRIALFGGAFNPIHNSHIQVAKFILNTSGYFDEVWLMPCYSHIYNKDMVSPEHRLKMCEIAIKDDARIKVFDYEIKKQLSGETYKLAKQIITDKQYDIFDFYYVIGQDNANTFDKWVNYEHLEKIAKFVVIPRIGYNINNKINWYLNKPHIYLNNDEFNIPELSSTKIRLLFKDIYQNGYNTQIQNEIETYLNKDIIKYILDNNLYNDK